VKMPDWFFRIMLDILGAPVTEIAVDKHRSLLTAILNDEATRRLYKDWNEAYFESKRGRKL